MEEMRVLLAELESSNRATVIEDLKCLAFLLNSDRTKKDHFFHLNGGPKVATFLECNDWDVINQSLRVLANAANCHINNQTSLTNRSVFKNVLRILHSIQFGNFMTLIYAVNFMSSLMDGNEQAQSLARKTGFFAYLNKKFHEMISALTSCFKEAERVEMFKTIWNSLCFSLRMLINNDKNVETQNEMRQYISEATELLAILLEKVKESHHALDFLLELIPLLKLIIDNNRTNQLKFAMCGGIKVIIRGLIILNEFSVTDVNLCQFASPLINLFHTLVNGNKFICEEVASLGAIPILLSLLCKIKDKMGMLLTLIQLFYNSKKNLSVFIHVNGIKAISELSKNSQNSPEIKQALSLLLRICGQNSNCRNKSSNLQCKSLEYMKPITSMNSCTSKFITDSVVLNGEIQDEISVHVDGTDNKILETENMSLNVKQGTKDEIFEKTDQTEKLVFEGTRKCIKNCNCVTDNYCQSKALLPSFEPGLTFYLYSVMMAKDYTRQNNILKEKADICSRHDLSAKPVKRNSHDTSIRLGKKTVTGKHHLIKKQKLQVNCSLEKTPQSFRQGNENVVARHLLDQESPAMVKVSHHSGKSFSEDIQNLITGVKTYGMDFQRIKENYRFHKRLSANDLYAIWKSEFIEKKSGRRELISDS